MGALGRMDRSWRTVVAASSAAAGALHLAAARPHAAEWMPAGLFMLSAGLLQLGWAVWITHRPTGLATFAGVVGNAATASLWVATRTVGPPFGPNAGMPEHVHGPDVLATLFELVIVVVCFRGMPASRPPRTVVAGVVTAMVATTTVAADDPASDRMIAAASLGLVWIAHAVAIRIPHELEVRRSNGWAPHVRTAVRRGLALGRAVVVARGGATR